VCHLPTKQEPDSLIASTPFQNPSPRRHTPIYTNCDGPNYRAPKELRLWCNPDHHRPWMQQRRNIPPVSNHSYRTTDHPTVLSTHIPVVRTPTTSHIRPRPLIHISLQQSTSKRTRNHIEPINGILFPNQQTHRMEESVGRTIPPPYCSQSRGLVNGITNCHTSTQ